MMCRFDKLGRSTVFDTTVGMPKIGKFSFSIPEILDLLSGAIDVKPGNLLASLSKPSLIMEVIWWLISDVSGVINTFNCALELC